VLQTGFGADECADVVRALMTDVLGMARFGAQGGDRGAFVSAGLGHRHHGAVIGIHLNLATGIIDSAAAMTSDQCHDLLGHPDHSLVDALLLRRPGALVQEIREFFRPLRGDA
jgi:hypothetical protein